VNTDKIGWACGADRGAENVINILAGKKLKGKDAARTKCRWKKVLTFFLRNGV
jgi:hypothetical protein